VAATFTWDGGSLVDNNWSTPENWVGNVAPPNDGTADIVMTGTTRPTPNVDTAWSINKLSFTGGTFTLGGSQLTVGAGGLASTGGTGPQTINNAIAVNGNQTWTANSATRALVVNGNLTGTSTILVNTSNIYNALRLGGSNTGFTGTLDLMNSNNQDMLLLKPSAMTGGTVLVGKSGANSNFHLMGAGSPGTYTMGVGSGAGELQFRLAGWGGVAPADGDVDWDPGNGGDYTLASGGFDFGAPVGGSPGINLGNSTSSLVFTGGNKASGASPIPASRRRW